MKQSDKEFLCYLICLSWDRLDDSERIRASKIIREITDKEDNLPDDLEPDYMTLEKAKKLDTEYIVEEKGKELYRVSLPESPDGRIYSSEDKEPERRGGPPDKVFYYNEGYCL